MVPFDKKNWFDYIIKLNDRELSKRNATGISLWALSAFVGVIFFKISEILPNIKPINGDLLSLFTLFFTSILSFLVFTILIIYAYITRFLNIEGMSVKIISPLNSLISVTINFTFSLIIILGSAGYLFILVKAKSFHLEVWSFWIIGIFFWLNFITDVLVFIFGSFFRTKQEIILNKAIKSFRNIPKKSASNIAVMVHILFFFMWYLTARSIDFQKYVIPNNETLKLSFYSVGILFCLFMFNYIYKSYIKGKWLEKFEKRIIAEDLEVDEIRDLFKAEYMDL